VNYLEPHLKYRPPRRLAEQFLPANATYEEAMEVRQEPWEYLAGNLTLSDSEFQLLRGLYRAEVAYVDEQQRRSGVRCGTPESSRTPSSWSLPTTVRTSATTA